MQYRKKHQKNHKGLWKIVQIPGIAGQRGLFRQKNIFNGPNQEQQQDKSDHPGQISADLLLDQSVSGLHHPDQCSCRKKQINQDIICAQIGVGTGQPQTPGKKYQDHTYAVHDSRL